MKKFPARSSLPSSTERSAPSSSVAHPAGETHAALPRPPPRRYPSLSDDGLPYFPRFRRSHRSAVASRAPAPSGAGDERWARLSVRVLALWAIFVIIFVLFASAW